MALGKALKRAGKSIGKAVTAPVKATKQLAKGNVKGSLKTAVGGAGAGVPAPAPMGAPTGGFGNLAAVAGPMLSQRLRSMGKAMPARGAVGAPPPQAPPVGQGGIAQDIFAGAPAPVGVPAGGFGFLAPLAAQTIKRGGFTGMGGGAALPAPALATAAPAIGAMGNMLAGQFGAPAKKPVQPGGFDMGGFDMGGGY